MIRALLGATALVWAAPALAQTQPDAARIAAAERLIEVTQIAAQLEQGFEMSVPSMAKNSIAQLAASTATRATFDELTRDDYARKQTLEGIVADELRTAIRAQMPRLKREYAREYAAAFSEAELRALTVFFTEGAGAKYVAQTPLLNSKLAATSQRIGMEIGMVALPKAMARAKTELDAETTK